MAFSSAYYVLMSGPLAAVAVPAVTVEARQFVILGNARDVMKNTQLNLDAVVNDYRQTSDRAGAAAITEVFNGLDAQIDIGIATVSKAIEPFSFGASKTAGNALLGPFVQSVADGLEAVVGNVVGGSLDPADFPVISSLQQNISRLIKQSQDYRINVTRLQLIQTLLQNSFTSGPYCVPSDIPFLDLPFLPFPHLRM
ncbi:hypothetical protein TRVA0_031S00408 [Trichomonascus vanleenenianus]|uniref:uncharacterized protein n=1 Tax=Trichomonascus vanleenenianus TaxID=2268995 RepID=UPI003ECA0239